MNCPLCGKEMKLFTGLRGVAPNYHLENGWYCTSGYECDLVGLPLYRDTLEDGAKIERLAAINRDNHFVKLARNGRG